jgi:hypothetical protein
MIKITCEVCETEIDQDIIDRNTCNKEGLNVQIEIKDRNLCDKCKKEYLDVIGGLFQSKIIQM